MPPKSKGKEQWNPSGKPADLNYAQCDLTEQDKPAFAEWLSGVSQDFSTVMQTVIDDSYRVSFKIDYNNSCSQCTFTQQDNKHHNANITLISRSDDFEEAFWLCVYKVYVRWEGQRLPTQAERPFWG